ncbi:zinc finger protein ZPR1-like protein isoform X1, partial [Tanacetum coccineum]
EMYGIGYWNCLGAVWYCFKMAEILVQRETSPDAFASERLHEKMSFVLNNKAAQMRSRGGAKINKIIRELGLKQVEGILVRAADELQALQDERKKFDPQTAEAIDEFILKLRAHATGNSSFTFILDDHAGNSFVENPYAPSLDPSLTIDFYEQPRSDIFDISNLGLSGGNLVYQLTSLTSLKNFDISDNNLSNQMPYDLPPNLETVNAEKSFLMQEEKSSLVLVSDSVEGKSVHDTKNAQKESSNNEPSTTDDVGPYRQDLNEP